MSPTRQASLDQATVSSQSLVALGATAGAALLAFCPSVAVAAVPESDASHVNAGDEPAWEFGAQKNRDEVGDESSTIKTMTAWRSGLGLAQVNRNMDKRSLLTFTADDSAVACDGRYSLPGVSEVKYMIFTSKRLETSFVVTEHNSNVFVQFWNAKNVNLVDSYHIKDWDGYEQQNMASTKMEKLMVHSKSAALYQSLIPGSGVYVPWRKLLTSGKPVVFRVGPTAKSGLMEFVRGFPFGSDGSQKVTVTPSADGRAAAVSWKDSKGHKKFCSFDPETMEEVGTEPFASLRLGAAVPRATMKEDLGDAGKHSTGSSRDNDTVPRRFDRLLVEAFSDLIHEAASRYKA